MHITPAMTNELERVIHALPGDDLVALARTEPDFLSGGFRASNVSALRTRVQQLATGAQPLNEPLRRLLQRHSLNPGCVRLLSVVVLTELRAALAALFGESRVLLAMLLDDRAEVQELATRWTQQEIAGRVVEPVAAAAQAREMFGSLLTALGASGGTDAPPVLTREAWQTARENLEQQLREARAEMRRLKGVEYRLARTRDQLAACERDKTATEARAVAAETLARQTARERDTARIELERELNHREERLTAALDTRLAEESAGWLTAAHAVAREAAAPAAGAEDALLARAAEALAHQVAVDRHSGNRAAVAARLERLDGQLAQARDALANALQPAPELAAVERELDAEATRVRQLLQREIAPPPLETALAARFAAAAPEQLVALRNLVTQLVALGALENGAVARLTAVLQRRQDVARATTPPPGAAVQADDDTPRGLLCQALAGRRAGVLLVDGHNVLFGLQGRYLPPAGAAVPSAAARTRLIEDIVQLTGGRPTCRAWIVFDGPARTENTAAANVRVTYSGGTGEHRADLVLLDNVRFFRSVGNTAVVLASNDNALCAEARRLGAHVISALDLGSLLG